MEELPGNALNLGVRILLAIIFFLIGTQIIKIIRKILQKSLNRAGADKGVLQFLDSLTKAGLYIFLIFCIASGFGVDATGVIAVLGSAGVAIGLAIQGSLSNFAGGVLILLLKPFKIGDYIKEDTRGNEGTVEEIQLFYTKLLTPDNRTIILPNGTLANSSMTNVTAADCRRMDIKVGISYEADIRNAKKVLERVLHEDKDTLKDKELVVYVDELGSSAVVLGIRCWFTMDKFWEGKWRITESVKYALDAAEISIPYQQMDVRLEMNGIKNSEKV